MPSVAWPHRIEATATAAAATPRLAHSWPGKALLSLMPQCHHRLSCCAVPSTSSSVKVPHVGECVFHATEVSSQGQACFWDPALGYSATVTLRALLRHSVGQGRWLHLPHKPQTRAWGQKGPGGCLGAAVRILWPRKQRCCPSECEIAPF